mmetsp:Transcript_149112/g.362115  ORF Transcript_149112/g.362115 Transcript_149112/m.362115 type:complete len:314 (-) Transcript_149112:459-1400(-)
MPVCISCHGTAGPRSNLQEAIASKYRRLCLQRHDRGQRLLRSLPTACCRHRQLCRHHKVLTVAMTALWTGVDSDNAFARSARRQTGAASASVTDAQHVQDLCLCRIELLRLAMCRRPNQILRRIVLARPKPQHIHEGSFLRRLKVRRPFRQLSREHCLLWPIGWLVVIEQVLDALQLILLLRSAGLPRRRRHRHARRHVAPRGGPVEAVLVQLAPRLAALVLLLLFLLRVVVARVRLLLLLHAQGAEAALLRVEGRVEEVLDASQERAHAGLDVAHRAQGDVRHAYVSAHVHGAVWQHRVLVRLEIPEAHDAL